ncbi:MAG: metallophosphoesterase [Egibacteraceae bacterium]
MTKRPPRPSSLRPEELGFRRQPMVRWFSPGEASQAAIRVILSKIFGGYADKRELQAALESAEPGSYAAEDELWIDFVADLGDGFDSTYSVASLLARPTLEVTRSARSSGDHTTLATQRGRILVMGGDEVYPSARVQAYQDRLVGPYRAALPWTDPPHPHLYAIPGNHDWYDGLTAFLRIFCQQRWIGGWLTKQTRSYFALELPYRWWLWGVDIQLDTSFDEPQLRYFRRVAEERVRPGDSIILCSAKSSWVDTCLHDPDAYQSLDYFDRTVIRPSGARLRVGLSGDRHHYSHYVEVGGDQHKITAGGGGAYLSATHHLPTDLAVPPPTSTDLAKSTPPARFRLTAMFPSRRRSQALRTGIWTLPFKNTGLWLLFAILQLGYSWSIFPGRPRALPLDAVALEMIKGPVAFVLNTTLFVGLVFFTGARSRPRALILGLGHAATHFMLAGALIAAVGGWLAALDLGLLFPIVLAVVVGGPGALLSCWLFALYLLVADMAGCNTNELFVAQRIEGFKNLLRMHLDKDGVLTIYPIGLTQISHNWRLRESARPDESWLEPDGPPLAPMLIEDPIRLDRVQWAGSGIGMPVT